MLEEGTGEILDPELATHGYQLWTAAVGTLIEAQEREVENVVMVVHQFLPRDLDAAKGAGDRRDWTTKLAANQDSLQKFVSALAAAGGRSYATDFVRAGTELNVIKVLSPIGD